MDKWIKMYTIFEILVDKLALFVNFATFVLLKKFPAKKNKVSELKFFCSKEKSFCITHPARPNRRKSLPVYGTECEKSDCRDGICP
jgi:hypothetical protein